MAVNIEQPRRLDYFDVFRGLGIILMIMGHVGFGGIFDHFIHAFHMPMFFYVSGFFYKNEGSFAYRFHKKAKVLLVPYAFFGVAHYVIYLLMQIVTKNSLDIEPLLRLLTINTDGLPIAGALWFLTALFITDIIYFVLDKYRVKWIIVPLVLIGSVADQYLPYPLPWGLSASFVGLGLFNLGALTRRSETKIKRLMNMSWIMIIVVGAVTTALIFFNGYINMREGKYAFIPLFWINALLAIFIGISISKKICVARCKVDWLKIIGKNSIVYVCLNQIIILFVSRLVACINFSLLVSKIIILGCSMVLLHFCCLLFTKTRLRWLVGK